MKSRFRSVAPNSLTITRLTSMVNAVLGCRRQIGSLGKLLIPIGISVAYALWIYFTDLSLGGRLTSLLSAYFFPPFGKESIIPLGLALGYSPMLLASSIIMIDFLTALFLAWNFTLIYRIPLLGWCVRRTEAQGKKILVERRWIKRFSLIGLFIFMVIPLQGTGALTTTLTGRTMGLGVCKVLTVVLMGSAVSSIMIAFFTDFLVSLLKTLL